MITILIASVVFLVTSLISIFYITVLYHRGLAHGSIVLSPAANWLIANTGIWMTGIDPKAWVCMHRAHLMHSDTDLDPHSPIRFGILGVGLGQLKSYKETLRGLIKKNPQFSSLVKDIEFNVNQLNRTRKWILPYLLHMVIGFLIGVLTGSPLIGAAYYFGIMSHPVHGWLVNSLAHKYGYRNFETKDHSTNNTIVSWLVAGEGLQNNHHARPKSANFAKKRGEVDFGFTLCRMASGVGLVQIK